MLTTNPDYIGIKRKKKNGFLACNLKYTSVDYTNIIGKYANIPFL